MFVSKRSPEISPLPLDLSLCIGKTLAGTRHAELSRLSSRSWLVQPPSRRGVGTAPRDPGRRCMRVSGHGIDSLCGLPQS